MRTPLQAVVSRQLPEFIREDYPTFVAFVEAYYEYMQTQGVNLEELRDIDTTLDSFVQYFKKEVAYNLPSNITTDERFLLQHIKDQYLSKGSEASYKLLFRLMFGKNVELTYPGRSMLIASDGRWNQEISIFVQVDYGSTTDIVGKLVDIQTGNKVLRVLVDRKEEMTGEIDRVVKIGASYEINSSGVAGNSFISVTTNTGIAVGQLVTAEGIAPNTRVNSVEGTTIHLSSANLNTVSGKVIFSNEIYELFLDKKFFGILKAGDKIRYKDQFQATILPATSKLNVVQPGKYFRIGQVFELQSGNGTGALMKVTAVTETGGIKYAEFIKFGIGYSADFAISILSANSVTSKTTTASTTSTSLIKSNEYVSAGAGSIVANSTSTSITGTGTNFGQVGGCAVGDELWTTNTIPVLIGVVKSITSATSLTLSGLPSEYEAGTTYSGTYTGLYKFRNFRTVGDLYTYDLDAEHQDIQAIVHRQTIADRTLGFNEQGYINLGDLFDYFSLAGSRTGTVSTTLNSPIVTGSGTNWLSTSAKPFIAIGDQLKTSTGAILGFVKSIDSNTQITLMTPTISVVSGATMNVFGAWCDGTYGGSIIREFSLNYRNAQTAADEPAIISIALGALQKYPGYFTTNNGFLDDSICIIDSRYFQPFSYVIRIDERLATYKSAVKTMLHPAGMALFGEFNITNNYDLSIALESLVKSLGIGLESNFDANAAEPYFTISKGLSTSLPNQSEYRTTEFFKALNDAPEPSDVYAMLFTKGISGVSEAVSMLDTSPPFEIGKDLRTSYSGMSDVIGPYDISKALADEPVISEIIANTMDKYLVDTPSWAYNEDGEIWTNSYQGQDYYSEEYSVGLSSTFTI